MVTSSRGRVLSAVACFFLATVITACSTETAILVEVTSPLASPEDIDQLEFQVAGQESGAMVSRRFDIDGWPQTLLLRPGANDSEVVMITAVGLSAGSFIARAEATSAFSPGELVTVQMVLGAGPPDAGGGDGGMDDGGPGCASDAECDDGVACTTDSCAVGVCVNTPENALCEVGTTCDPEFGCPPRTCTVDGDCDDRSFCNGIESCTGGECQSGTPVVCDDMDDCTTDACDDAMLGMCAATTRDVDGDGFGDSACAEAGGVPATDCNDGAPAIFPGAPEDCNGADDDCNGTCDDGFNCCRGVTETCMTSCGSTGMRTCNAMCSWGVCAAPPETCNGVDDDCNGAPDDPFACVMGATDTCTTTCGSTGMRTCDGTCNWTACMAPAEVCNGTDDDCDGTPDEDFACVQGSTVSCTTSCGSTGMRSCGSSCTLGPCMPPAEGCTGRDDDCDGNIDETVQCSAGSMGSCTTSCGSTGSRTCGAMCMWGTCNPPTEICNGNDDDCDGLIDETETCVPGATGSCTASCGTTGTRTCNSSCAWGACGPPAESCNGADDDCDGSCDETFTCCAGSSGSCMTTCGSTGTRTCSGSCGWSACSPPAETCNGMDDDCNAVCDDGFACCAGSTGSCTTSCGSTGTRNCSGSCAWGACSAPAETCNGLDDDCDTSVDEAFACVAGMMQTCTTSCGSTGNQTCNSSCAWGSCTPPVEACNGVDDDCDMSVDEGCMGCGACAGATTVSGLGGRYTPTLVPHANTGSCGGSGSEAYLTFTLSATSDVFITTHHSGIDTVLYVRDCACNGTERDCNDDADGLTSSTLRLTSLAAGSYNVFVDTKAPMSGTIPVDIYITAPGVAGDRCGQPTLIPASTITISGGSTCALNDDAQSVNATGCTFIGGGAAQDAIYYFYLPTSRTVTFSGCNGGVDYDTTAYIRSVCTEMTSSNQVACNDDGCSGAPMSCTGGLRSSVSATIGPGLFYFFADGYFEPPSWLCDCGNYQYDITGL